MNIPHLDDEALSAALDREATPDEQAHLAGCQACQAGVDRLASVARAVAAPVSPLAPGDVGAAVDRALASTERLQPSTERLPPSTVRSQPSTDPVAARLASAPPRRGPARWGTLAAGLAAAVIVALGVVALARSTRSTHTTTAAPAAVANGPQPATSGGTGPTSGRDATTVDLGDQSDPAALAQEVKVLLGPSVALAAPTDRIHSPANVPANGAPAAQAAPPPPCAAQGRAAAGLAATDNESATVVASLRWQGQPAVVLVYRPPAGPVGVVMRTTDCARLARLPL